MTRALRPRPSVRLAMRLLTSLVFTVACSALAAQGYVYLPASLNLQNQEAVDYVIRPFMQQDCRAQFLFDALEVGATTLTIDQLALRYDGPIPRVGAPGPFTMQRLRIRVGATDVAAPCATFADNLSQPLVTVFDGPFTYSPDPGSQVPHPWGVGGMDFAFTAPATVTIQSGGHLVIELIVEGNLGGGLAHTILDAARGIGGPVDGTAITTGQGCAAAIGAPVATITSTGRHAPGAAHFVAGANLGANAPGFLLLGISDQFGAIGALPFGLPGTTCSLYNSAEFALPVGADSSGAVLAGPTTAISVPAIPTLLGAMLFEQFVTIVPGANPFDLVLSDQRAVTLGPWNAPSRGTWMISHGTDANSPVADAVDVLGLAIRLRTL